MNQNFLTIITINFTINYLNFFSIRNILYFVMVFNFLYQFQEFGEIDLFKKYHVFINYQANYFNFTYFLPNFSNWFTKQIVDFHIVKMLYFLRGQRLSVLNF